VSDPKAPPRLIDPQALARLKGVSLRAKSVVDGVLQGMHRSPHQGASIEFAEHKEYSPGDEIKHVDWKVYGRLDKYYVKKFEHETNLRAFMVIDGSASMGYGADGMLTGAACWRADGTPVAISGGLARAGIGFSI